MPRPVATSILHDALNASDELPLLYTEGKKGPLNNAYPPPRSRRFKGDPNGYFEGLLGRNSQWVIGKRACSQSW